MKKLSSIATLAIAAVCTVTAGCASCSAPIKNSFPLASTWYTDTTFKGIQPTVVQNSDKTEYVAEKLGYTVKYSSAGNGANSTYSVTYADGEYTTEFYATEFDKSRAHESFKDYPDGKLLAYCYKTSFSCPEVKFSFGGESKTFTDSITTECYFLPVSDGLRPLYSKTEINSPSPSTYAAVTLENCYTFFDRTYETFYNFAGTEAVNKLVARDGGESYEKTVPVVDATNFIFDSNSLGIVARATSASALPQKFTLMTAANGLKEFTVNAYTGSAHTLSDEEKTAAATLLQSKNLYTPQEGKPLETIALSVTSTLSLSGGEPIYWFTKVSNPVNNSPRATLIKYVEPLTYGLGTLTYTLAKIDSTFWNG